MRISTNTIFEVGSARLSDLQASLVRQQEQIATGRRMLTPADDPIAAARALEVSQSKSANSQFATNRQNAKDSLSQEEGALQSVTDILHSVKTTVVNAGNGSLDDTQRKDLATQLQGQFAQLLGLANSTDATGNYLFAGYQTTSAPFSQSAIGAQYTGDQGERVLQVGPTQQLALSDAGNNVFENGKTGNGTFATAAAAGNAGSGIVSSGAIITPSIRVLPGVHTGTGQVGNVTLDSSYIASTLTPAVTLTYNGGTNELSGFPATLPVTVTNNGVATVFPAGSPVTYAAGATINFGGVNFALSGAPATGDTYTLSPSALTGNSYSLNFHVTAGVTTYDVVDSTTSTTLSSGNTYVSGQAISFDGMSLDVKGSPADGDQFSTEPSTKQSIFTTLRNLINVLNTPSTGAVAQAKLTNGLSDVNNNVGNALDNILTVRASIGSRLNSIDALDSNGSDKDLQYSQTLSQLQDLDYTKAITELTQQQTTLTAAQQSFVKISGLSLFNYL